MSTQAPGGMPVPYYVLDRDGFYYRGFQKPWSSHLHYAAQLSESLAERLAKRYPGSQIEKEMAYAIQPLETLASVNEPEAKTLLAEAIKTCKRENWSLETIQVQVQQIYDKAKVQ